MQKKSNLIQNAKKTYVKWHQKKSFGLLGPERSMANNVPLMVYTHLQTPIQAQWVRASTYGEICRCEQTPTQNSFVDWICAMYVTIQLLICQNMTKRNYKRNRCIIWMRYLKWKSQCDVTKNCMVTIRFCLICKIRKNWKLQIRSFCQKK